MRYLVSLLLLCAGLAVPGGLHGQTVADRDQQVLQGANVDTTPAGLASYFRARTLKPADKGGLEALAQQLLKAEDPAPIADQLAARGMSALPVLRAALEQAEDRKRVEAVVRKIEAAHSAEVTAAAARRLLARDAGAADLLFDFLPMLDDRWLEDEVLDALGKLLVREGKATPWLNEALKHPEAHRRATAAYLLGRRGDLTLRGELRTLLADAAAEVRQSAAQGLLGRGGHEILRDTLSGDEAVLQRHGVELTSAGVLEYFRKRTLKPGDEARLQTWVSELGSESFATRMRASEQLIREGTPALAYLQPALASPDFEALRRAQWCAELIRRAAQPAVTIAAAHVLTKPGLFSADSIATLLAFVPFAEDEAVEEAILESLALLSVRGQELDPALAAALNEGVASRRAAAAYVLGQVGTAEHQAQLRKLLGDAEAQVRWRAAQGLIAAHDRAAVPTLIDLLGELPTQAALRIEETLHRLASETAPANLKFAETPGERQKSAKAWAQWWEAHGAAVDLAALHENNTYLGLITVAEYDSVRGSVGQVWEGARSGPPRWKFSLQGAMDAQSLPHGHVLVAENSRMAVTERDAKGTVVWEHRVQGNPIAAQRLPNGNTFIALYNQVLEVTPKGAQVYSHTPGPDFYIFGAQKTRANTIVAITAQGMVMELDAFTGKQLRKLNTGANGNWCGVELLRNGNFLIANLFNAQIREMTPEGKVVWSATYQGVFRATRLPNGNTLVASMTTRKIAELDRSGATLWERTCEGRPWSIRYR